MEIFSQALKWLDEGKKVAIATVIQKQGSALRGVGSKMGISSEMEMAGSVSGGCIEGAVIQEALVVMKSGRNTIVDYGISDDTAWSVGLACGGQVKILIQPIRVNSEVGLAREKLEKILKIEKFNKPFCLITEITDKNNNGSTTISDGTLIFPREVPQWMDKTLIKELSNLETN